MNGPLPDPESMNAARNRGPKVLSGVRKPVDFTEFSEAVRQLGLYRLLLNEPLPD